MRLTTESRRPATQARTRRRRDEEPQPIEPAIEAPAERLVPQDPLVLFYTPDGKAVIRKAGYQ